MEVAPKGAALKWRYRINDLVVSCCYILPYHNLEKIVRYEIFSLPYIDCIYNFSCWIGAQRNKLKDQSTREHNRPTLKSRKLPEINGKLCGNFWVIFTSEENSFSWCHSLKNVWAFDFSCLMDPYSIISSGAIYKEYLDQPWRTRNNQASFSCHTLKFQNCFNAIMMKDNK